ncbi:MAG: acyl-CoA dehydrogenase domain-containing protein [Pseudomonadota bacterium]
MAELIAVAQPWLAIGWVWWTALALTAVVLFFVNAPGAVWFGLHVLLLTGFVAVASDVSALAKAITCLLYLGPLVLLGFGPVRRRLVCRPALLWYRDILPPISAADRAAMAVGTVAWDGEFFRGRPRWRRMMAQPAPALSVDERRFVDGATEALCATLNDTPGELPEPVVDDMRRGGFFALQVPAQYGGHSLSDCAVAAVISRVASTSLAAAMGIFYANAGTTVTLLLRHGTPAQRERYLPRLASGDEVACFAYTEPGVGSDVSAFDARAVVAAGPDGAPALRVSFDKHLVSLAPLATLATVVLRVNDPERMLEQPRDSWTGLALVPLDAAAVTVHAADRLCTGCFPVGRLSADGAELPVDALLGGPAQAGEVSGWLAAARIVSRTLGVPALATATAKLASRACGAYARIRFHGGAPLGYFGGIQEQLARMAADTYCLDSLRCVSLGGLADDGGPLVPASIVKYEAARRIERVAASARRVHGGTALTTGRPNLWDGARQLAELAPAMDPSDIAARSHLVFARGILRSHPFLRDEINAAIHADSVTGLRRFDRLFTRHLGTVFSNGLRALLLAVGGGRLASTPRRASGTRRWFRALSRMSAAFALTADLLLLVLRGNLARHERISGRMADCLTALYVGAATLKHFRDGGSESNHRKLVDRVLGEYLASLQDNLDAVLRNFPRRWLGRLLRVVVFPFGRPYRAPPDALDATVAQLLLVPSAARERLTAGLYQSGEHGDTLHRLDEALARVIDTKPLHRKLRRALTIDLISGNSIGEWIDSAEQARVLTGEEARLLREAEAMRKLALALR